MKMMENLMAARRGQSGSDSREKSGTQPRSTQGRMPGMGRPAGQGRSGQQMPRIWMEDENGELQMVFLQTGVTDNTYTEVIGETLKVGQSVITGLESGASSSSNSRNTMGRGMMFMRR